MVGGTRSNAALDQELPKGARSRSLEFIEAGEQAAIAARSTVFDDFFDDHFFTDRDDPFAELDRMRERLGRMMDEDLDHEKDSIVITIPIVSSRKS